MEKLNDKIYEDKENKVEEFASKNIDLALNLNLKWAEKFREIDPLLKNGYWISRRK